MINLTKKSEKDFIILNLTDPQLKDSEWENGHINRKILEYTVKELVSRVKPDLITITGDLAWAGHNTSYDALADLLDSFGIPWAPVWGNHDNQDGAEAINAVATRYMSHPLCIYEKGDPMLGNGNYVIAIEQDGKIVEGVIMMDSHDRAPYTKEDGTVVNKWAKLTPEQIVWYRQQISELKNFGCNDTALMMHIPIYGYREAWNAAISPTIDPNKIELEESTDSKIWNDGYKDSYGVKYEGIGSYPEDEGMLSVIKELSSTKHIISGHDHINNFIIKHEGVKFIYGLKTGAGCYWDLSLNGGTVLRVTDNGITDVWHEYVDVRKLL